MASTSSSSAFRGPAALIRVGAASGSLEMQPPGRELLQSLPNFPTTIVFAVGGSRAGKSSVGNELLGRRINFPVGHGFQHVTDGVDVGAFVDEQGQRILLYCDCEGSFHPTGSRSNAHGFGPMGLLASCFEKGGQRVKNHGKIGNKVAGFGGQSQHRFESGSHEICM